MTLKVTILRHRRPLIVALHCLMVAASNYAAFLLRFDFTFPPQHWGPFLASLPVLILIRSVAFWTFRLYVGLWRYASVWDLQRIILAVALSSVFFAAIARWPLNLFLPYPRSVLVIDSLVMVMLLGGARLARRAYREFNRIETEKRVLVYGAGDAGEMIVRDMRNNRFYNCRPIGFIDDDPGKVGRSIHGVKVLGTRDDLPHILAEEQPHEVLVAMPRAEPAQIRSVVRSLERFKVPIKTLPNMRDVIDGKVEIGQIRSLAPADLLARSPVSLDPEPVRRLVNGRRVLVTGAGGSIGSELARQLAGFGPSRLLLIERYENALFDVCNDLEREHPGCRYEPLVADITDAPRIDSIFAALRPEVVFHAAAHKHVPLMERNPAEAVKNNVRGTRIMAQAAAKHEAGEFVLISSDKAVNPSSVMGATKRVCEFVVRSLNRPGGARFMAVRFGNVLDSNGSVTQVFAGQIARGGPVTVTHPEIRRFFMLIPEAVQLVLHAAAMRDPGTIYALDMGEQIRIQDLARNLIRLSGFVPDDEIEIQFVGLRPGEKLCEELLEEGEATESSGVAHVLRVKAAPVLTDLLWAGVTRLERAAEEEREADVVRLLSEIVPTFRLAAMAGPRAVPRAEAAAGQ
jgi:FlaA1/EpsC-like NDP-sugar epimerase